MKFISKYLFLLPILSIAAYFSAPTHDLEAAFARPVDLACSMRSPASSPVSATQRARERNFSLARFSPAHVSKAQVQNTNLEEWNGYDDGSDQLKKIYHADITRDLKEHYKGTVAPAEQVVEDPYRFARPWDRQRYVDQDKEMAQWTAKEILNDRLQHVLNGADKSSAPVVIAQKAKFLMGAEMGGGDDKKEEIAAPKPGLKPLPQQVKAGKASAVVAADAAPAEEKIPTRLRYKMNVIHQTGSLRFTNPIVETSVNVDMNNKTQDGAVPTLDTSDRVSAQMTKTIKPINVNSSVIYGVNKKVVSVNLSKKITDQITCDVTSQHFTDDSRNSAGSRGTEEVKMQYSISF